MVVHNNQYENQSKMKNKCCSKRALLFMVILTVVLLVVPLALPPLPPPPAMFLFLPIGIMGVLLMFAFSPAYSSDVL
ncbi:hypothetical protein LIER_10281 [Lithospermum erythrorhizon]|uniref:Transmembrane protein n=1 Tax=Lithospermum erythrorhizon TaxID=34254 RepID=A0AAV3PKH0_LITER